MIIATMRLCTCVCVCVCVCVCMLVNDRSKLIDA